MVPITYGMRADKVRNSLVFASVRNVYYIALVVTLVDLLSHGSWFAKCDDYNLPSFIFMRAQFSGSTNNSTISYFLDVKIST